MRVSYKNNFSGWSLLEMIVALTIFGIVMAAIFGVLVPMVRTFNRQQIRHDLFMQTETSLKALDKKVTESFGWLEGDTLRLSVVTTSGDTLSIRRNNIDSMLYINDKTVFPQGFKCIDFKIGYKPMVDSAMAMTFRQSFESADADGNGLIQGTEISKVASLELILTVYKASESYTGKTYPRIPPAIVGIDFGGSDN